MANLIGITGESGSGKSTSIESLDPKVTYIINVAGKELPFKGSSKLYNKDNKNYKELEDARLILDQVTKVANELPHVKEIIIEDANYIMGFNLVNKATETGYTKFSVMAKDIVHLVQGVKKLRNDLNIYYITHSEPIEDSGEVLSYKMKTAGKMIDSQITLEGLFTVVLYADTETKGDKTEYNFITNKYKKYPAKSPKGMFDTIKIPNNLANVSKKVREYYQ